MTASVWTHRLIDVVIDSAREHGEDCVCDECEVLMVLMLSLTNHPGYVVTK